MGCVKVQVGDFSKETFDLTSKLLTWNPEYYTVWNHRRRIILHSLALDDNLPTLGLGKSLKDLIASDLEFLIPLLRKYPKCYWIWKYRHWLLEQANSRLTTAIAFSFWEHELLLASKMLAQDSRNFHAWGYRRKVFEAMEILQRASSTAIKAGANGIQTEGPPAHVHGESDVTLTQQEFDYTTRMINANLSNFSAWHHRGKVVLKLLNEKNADAEERRRTLNTELELVQRALYTGDNDQSPWFYHQYLMCTFDPRYAAASMAPDLTEQEKARYVAEEIERTEEMLDGADDNKWIYQALIQLMLLNRKITGEWPEERRKVPDWLEQLRALDPLRAGKWHDLEKQLDTREGQLGQVHICKIIQ